MRPVRQTGIDDARRVSARFSPGLPVSLLFFIPLPPVFSCRATRPRTFFFVLVAVALVLLLFAYFDLLSLPSGGLAVTTDYFGGLWGLIGWVK